VRPKLRSQQAALAEVALCARGDGTRDQNNVITCKGCNMKFSGSAKFIEHTQIMKRSLEGQEPKNPTDQKPVRKVTDVAKPAVVERLIREQESGAVSPEGIRGGPPPGLHPQPQQQLMTQLDQQQQQYTQHLLATRQQALAMQAQPTIAERSRQIALLEQELKVQQMMMEVERREAALQQQACFLAQQAQIQEAHRKEARRQDLLKQEELRQEEALKARREEAQRQEEALKARKEEANRQEAIRKAQEQEQQRQDEAQRLQRYRRENDREEATKNRSDVTQLDQQVQNRTTMIPPNAIYSATLEENWYRERIETRIQQELISKMKMEQAAGPPVDEIENNTQDASIFYSTVNEESIIQRNCETEDFIDPATLQEQLKIMEQIKMENKIKEEQEEQSRKLISELQIEEVRGNRNDPVSANEVWPELPAVKETKQEAFNENAASKISRLKSEADKIGMSIYTKVIQEDDIDAEVEKAAARLAERLEHELF